MVLTELTIPELKPEAIRDAVKNIAVPGQTRRLVAFYGTGRSDSVTMENGERLDIVPVRSEIDLRSQLPALDAETVMTAYLVPWQREIPIDLAGRFAQRGRVISIGQAERLRSRLGCSAVDPALRSHPLTRYLLRSDNTSRYNAGGGYLNEDGLWALWLRQDWGLECEGSIGRDSLLAWAAESERGQAFQQAMADASAAGLREQLEEYLQRHVGLLGRVAIRQWERGRGLLLLAFGVLCEALVQADSTMTSTVQIWTNQNLKSQFDVPVDQAAKLATELAEATGMALRLLTSARLGNIEAKAKLAKLVVANADQMVDSDIRAAVSQSTRLPTAWQLRLEELGQALKLGAKTPNDESVKLARARLRGLERHEFFRHNDDERTVKRADMAVRLLVWLTSQQRQPLAGIGTNFAEAERLAQWYVTEGGYVDWARRAARGTPIGALGEGIQSVLEAVDAKRLELDELFAKDLAEWHQAQRPEQRIIPIDHALARIAVPFLKAGQRRLLVILMDGMAWAQAVQLLNSMQRMDRNPWAPLAWHAMNRIGDARYPAVLANLPTVTEVSRSAFFAGKAMPNGSVLNTSLDPKRFAENKDLHPYCDNDVAPTLMLKDSCHNKDGSASEAALTMISDEKRQIVALVINAIDASLMADSQQYTEWEIGTIKSLSSFLDAAREANRHVLLASDHGHVPSDRLSTLSSPSEAGARYRRWPGSADPIQPGERAFSGPGVYAAKDMKGAVLITNDTKRYGGSSHAGEHGGATLGEVVAPCILLGWDDPVMQSQHADLRPVPHFVPDWWHFEVTPPPVASGAAKPTTKASSKRPPSSSQLKLDLVTPPEPLPAPAPVQSQVPALVPPTDDPRFATLMACEMLRNIQKVKPEREKTVHTILYLLDRGGAVHEDVFAKYLDLPPYRVAGAVSRLTEILNVDGYDVVRLDRDSHQVRLDQVKLEQQFEVKL